MKRGCREIDSLKRAGCDLCESQPALKFFYKKEKKMANDNYLFPVP